MNGAIKGSEITLTDLQRWCAKENAQIIFNGDGTVYSAMGEQTQLHQCHFAVLSAMVRATMEVQ